MDAHYHHMVKIPIGKVVLQGEVVVPMASTAIVIFAHGSGSSRFSSRNRLVASFLHKNNISTLLFDLLTPDEDTVYENRFNIELLTTRLVGATQWIQKFEPTADMNFGFFGASTGAASALRAAASMPATKAVVSRGGRVDMAGELTTRVKAPTLLIVGSLDFEVLKYNYQALMDLNCVKKLEIVNGATHLFEEEGMMNKVTELATDWFKKFLIEPITVQA